MMVEMKTNFMGQSLMEGREREMRGEKRGREGRGGRRES